jgi:hypothetical protein
MNNISTFWQGIVNALNANKDSLGIGMPPKDPEDESDLGLPGAERAQTGKVNTFSPPSVAVWIEPQAATFISQDGALMIPVDVHVFCVGAPTTTEADSVDNAIEIAVKVTAYLTNKEIAATVLYQPDNEPVIAIVERSSTESVVGVLLKAQVEL